MYPYDNYNNFGGMPQVSPQPQYNFNQQFQRQNPQPQTNTNKIYVSGIDEVRTKGLSAGSDFIFLDNDKPILYQKIVSPNGQFEVKTFKIVPFDMLDTEKKETSVDLSNYVKVADLEPLKAEILEIKSKLINKAGGENAREKTDQI